MSKKLGTCDNLETLHTENWQCVGTWQPVTATAEPAEYTCPRCDSNVSTHICMGEPVAGETKYAPLDTKACFNTAAHFEHSWDYRNKTFRCLGKPICPSVAVPEGEAKPARTVTHQMARDAFRKMHDALYNNAPIPSLSIPARLDDADIVLSDYICQQRDVATPPTNPVSTAWLPAPGDWLLDHPNYDKWPRRNDSQISTLDDIQFNWITVVKLMSEYAAHVLAEKGK